MMLNAIEKERLELAVGRIKEICKENKVQKPFYDYFQKTTIFIQKMIQCKQDVQEGYLKSLPIEQLREQNHTLYEDILPGRFEQSYGNPKYACAILGDEYGKLLSFLYTEIRGLIVYAYEKREWDFLVVIELFLQVYHAFSQEEIPSGKEIQDILYWYVNDYCSQMVEYRVRESIDPSLSFAAKIIREEDLNDLRYLYYFGEYITEEEEKVAAFLQTLPQSELEAMARTYTEGYRIGFELAGIDLSKKKSVNIRYVLGFEKMIKIAIEQFEKMGLNPILYRAATHSVDKRQQLRIGYYGAIPNPQYDYDHRNDCNLYLDEDFVGRKLRALQNAYEKYKDLAKVHAGPAVVEIFGEKPFVPISCEKSLNLTEKQQKLQVHMSSESGQITNRYIPGDERSFTIIAFPVPSIGSEFEAIFRETVRINTLDYHLYQKIQQKMIDALDKGETVHIKGAKDNKTDLCIQLHKLRDCSKETNFENCVADVNIPVGEVFTSPMLKGTNGILHVKQVYLNGLQYLNLEIEFQDGMVSRYHCENFEDEEKNQEYIRENILHHHKSLPMGEFAIGTNTTAYKMGRDYQIQDKLPILIAEKTGPHFAVGDTCYSWSEDSKVYNPDGKEIIARDNEISLLRKKDVSKAYFGCHTDITIPYEELGYIVVKGEDGDEISIFSNGRFVLEGTEELNPPLEMD